MKEVRKLVKEVEFYGEGLHTGNKSRIKIKPADSGGICFYRKDKDVRIPANLDSVVEHHRNTVIGKEQVVVETIEHLMASLFLAHIKNAIIEIDSNEVPILDGSAKFFYDALIKNSIIEKQVSKDCNLTITNTCEFNNNSSRAIIKPSEEFNLHVKIDFPQRIIGIVEKDVNLESDEEILKIINAKTFVLLSEIVFLAARGLIKGGSVHNALVLKDKDLSSEEIALLENYFGTKIEWIEKQLITEENYTSSIYKDFREEILYHKILDFIGDFSLLGCLPNVNIFIEKPGHLANVNVAKIVKENLIRS